MPSCRLAQGLGRRAFLATVRLAAQGVGRATASTLPAAVGAAQVEVEAIVSRFMARARSMLPGVQAPRVVIAFTPQLSWIEEDGSAIHTLEWSQCPPDMQGDFASLLGDAPALPAATFFHEVFNAYLVPHEMSHFVDARRGQLKNGGDF